MAETTPKKIAILLSSLKFGGGERVALSLAKALQENGCRIDVLLMSKEGEFLAEAEANFRVIDLQCDKTYKLPSKILAYVWRNQPDALISSYWKLNLCSCVTKLFFPRVKLLLWEHSLPSRSSNSPKWLYAITASIFYQFSNKVIVVSTGVYKDIDRLTVGLRRKLQVIFNPIAPPNSALFCKNRTCRSDRKLVISVGRLEQPKNPNILLEAFALIPRDRNITLAYVGDGKLRAGLEQRAQALGIGDRVKFLGYLSNPYEIMLEADLLVLSSDHEGFGNVIVEAMHCGLRVVSTDCSDGIRDILLENYYGTIVPPRDAAALAMAIESELETKHCCETQKNGAVRFLPQVAAQQFLAIMR